jgi:putative cell wall-binding protein
MTRAAAHLRGLVPVLVVALAAALLAPPPAAAAPAPAVLDVAPLPGTVVARGHVAVGGTVVADTAIREVRLLVDGRDVPAEVSGPDTQRTVRARVPLDPGEHVIVVEARLADGRAVTRAWRHTVADLGVSRLGGRTRTDTARLVAEQLTGAERSPAAVLARADGFADALAGVGLAHALGAPLLLTPSAGLDEPARRGLADAVAGGGVVHLLGGGAALAAQVEADVRALGLEPRRLAGADRYATAAAVAEAAAAARTARERDTDDTDDTDDTGGTGDPDADAAAATVLVASGEDFADALAASPPAAVRGWPLLLTARDHLPEATRALLAELAPAAIELVGGAAAVDPAVERSLAELAPVTRTAGPTRFATAARIAERLPAAGASVVLASGLAYPDALAGGVLAARDDAPLLLAAETLPADSGRALGVRGPSRLVVLGGAAAVPDAAVRGALRAHADGGVPPVEAPTAGTRYRQEDGPGHGFGTLRLRLPGVALRPTAQASLLVDGREALVGARVEGDTLHVDVARLPEGLPRGSGVPVRLHAHLAGEGRSAHVEVPLAYDTRPPTTVTREGFLAIASTGPVHGTGGTLRTFSLEVEPATGEDLFSFAEEVEGILADPRGWTGRGTVRFQRVEPGRAQVRILLARPATVDRLCAGVANTAGRYSCWSGRFAALNLDRWRTGATHRFDAPLSVYRGYLVNHEVGHALGHGHVGCPAPGALAPVMMQQSKGTGQCRPNAWPYP